MGEFIVETVYTVRPSPAPHLTQTAPPSPPARATGPCTGPLTVHGVRARVFAGIDPGILVFAGVYFALITALGAFWDAWCGELVRDFHVGARTRYRGVMYGAEWLAWASDSCLASAAMLKTTHGRQARGRRRNLRGAAARHRWRAREQVRGGACGCICSHFFNQYSPGIPP